MLFDWRCGGWGMLEMRARGRLCPNLGHRTHQEFREPRQGQPVCQREIDGPQFLSWDRQDMKRDKRLHLRHQLLLSGLLRRREEYGRVLWSWSWGSKSACRQQAAGSRPICSAANSSKYVTYRPGRSSRPVDLTNLLENTHLYICK